MHPSILLGVCQRQHNKMLVAFEQAQDMGVYEKLYCNGIFHQNSLTSVEMIVLLCSGLIKVPLPFRTYNYTDYYKQSEAEENNKKQ
jgi:hypothetical protein